MSETERPLMPGEIEKPDDYDYGEMVAGEVVGSAGLYDHKRVHRAKGEKITLPASMAMKFKAMDVLRITNAVKSAKKEA